SWRVVVRGREGRIQVAAWAGLRRSRGTITWTFGANTQVIATHLQLYPAHGTVELERSGWSYLTHERVLGPMAPRRGTPYRRGCVPEKWRKTAVEGDPAAPRGRARGVDSPVAPRTDGRHRSLLRIGQKGQMVRLSAPNSLACRRSEEHTSELQSRENLVCR